MDNEQDNDKERHPEECYTAIDGYRRRRQKYNELSLHPQAETVRNQLAYELYKCAESKRMGISEMKKNQDRFIYFGGDDFPDEDDWMGDDTIMILGNETNAPSPPNVQKMRKWPDTANVV